MRYNNAHHGFWCNIYENRNTGLFSDAGHLSLNRAQSLNSEHEYYFLIGMYKLAAQHKEPRYEFVLSTIFRTPTPKAKMTQMLSWF